APTRSPLVPYTTLFRSEVGRGEESRDRALEHPAQQAGVLLPEVGGDDAGVEGHGIHPGGMVTAVQFLGYQDVAQFGVAVGAVGGEPLEGVGVGFVEFGEQ